MCVMMKPHHALLSAATGRIALAAIAIAAALCLADPSQVNAQSADLVLCDRLAADPADPDKPADVKGTPDVAPSDIATAIKYCKVAAGSSRRALYQLGRAYAANRQMPEAIAAWRKAADKGSTSAMVELGVLYGTGAGRRQGRSPGAKAVRARRRSRQSARRQQSCRARSAAAARRRIRRARGSCLAKAAETNAEAQYQLGLMLADGTGGAKDDAGARSLFEKAAAQNHAGALERMGAFTRRAAAGRRIRSAAKAYYERAAALGDEDAKKALKRIECPYAIKDKRGNLVTNLCF